MVVRVLPGVQPPLSERVFHRSVLELARVSGWRCFHFRPAKTEQGWRTAVEGDGGYPDLTLVRDRVVFAELKTGKGKLSKDQAATVAALRLAAAEVYVWRPDDWEEIATVLTRRPAR